MNRNGKYEQGVSICCALCCQGNGAHSSELTSRDEVFFFLHNFVSATLRLCWMHTVKARYYLEL